MTYLNRIPRSITGATQRSDAPDQPADAPVFPFSLSREFKKLSICRDVTLLPSCGPSIAPVEPLPQRVHSQLMASRKLLLRQPAGLVTGQPLQLFGRPASTSPKKRRIAHYLWPTPSALATIDAPPLLVTCSNDRAQLSLVESRLMMAVLRKIGTTPYLWTCRHIGVNSAGNNDNPPSGTGPADRSGIEWFKIQTTPSVSVVATGRIFTRVLQTLNSTICPHWR